MNVYVQDPQQTAKACMIVMHGLGADASDMIGFVQHPLLSQLAVRFVFMDAPIRPVTINGGMSMRAWYDILDITFNGREDEAGIKQSHGLVNAVIEQQIAEGFQSHQIILAGFSQGGAMALYSALHSPRPLAGVVCLSGYLPLAPTCQPVLEKSTPIFVGYGLYDPIVLPHWTTQSVEFLKTKGFNNISNHSYLMEHSICPEEIRDLSHWLSLRIEGEIS